VALFSRKKGSRDSDSFTINDMDEILGYLDEVFRRRVSVSYIFNKKEYVSDVLLLDTKLGAMRIQQSTVLRIPHGADILAGFSLDRTWWSFQTKLMMKDNKPYLLVPKVIAYAERRRNQRTNFSPREQVKVTILEGLGSGHGVFGLAQDISVDGLSLTVERAMNLTNEKEVPPSPTLFPKGTKLAVVKINKIPGCPQLEVMGEAQRLERDGKWVMAISFHKLSKQHQAMIARFVEPRLLEFKPTRRSLKRRQELESEGPLASPAAGSAMSEEAESTQAKQDNEVSEPEATLAETADAASAETPTEPKAETPAGPKIKALVMGGELMNQLDFLTGIDDRFALLPGNTPVGIIKTLAEQKPDLVLCGTEFKGRSIFEVLEKIDNMGALSQTKVVVCAEKLQPSDKIKFKMMRIEHILDLGDGNESFARQLAELG